MIDTAFVTVQLEHHAAKFDEVQELTGVVGQYPLSAFSTILRKDLSVREFLLKNGSEDWQRALFSPYVPHAIPEIPYLVLPPKIISPDGSTQFMLIPGDTYFIPVYETTTDDLSQGIGVKKQVWQNLLRNHPYEVQSLEVTLQLIAGVEIKLQQVLSLSMDVPGIVLVV